MSPKNHQKKESDKNASEEDSDHHTAPNPTKTTTKMINSRQSNKVQ